MSESDKAIAQPPNRGVDRVFQSKGTLMLANLLGGLAWGVGSVLGATLVVATILFLLNFLGGLPVIGSFITDMADAISSGMGR